MPRLQFQQAVLAWFDQHGRHDLPWQQNITPYRVWVSEIMLQQTQVQTAIPYFTRFLQKLPKLESLASASEDEVLHLWSGLGYYSRARNLHRSAQLVMTDHGGHLPAGRDALMTLPGIGRSTAGAILALAHRKQAAILDGNVKRVLARYHAVAGWPGRSPVLKQLWQYAEDHTPAERVHHYTQAMMDLGATVCTRSSPRCDACPLAANCQAYRRSETALFPGKKPRAKLPARQCRMLIIENQHGEILLQKRPPSGIWASLWAFPELEDDQAVDDFCQEQLRSRVIAMQEWDPHGHSFSHFHLTIQPLHVSLDSSGSLLMEPERALWYNRHQPQQIGLAAPVRKLMDKLESGLHTSATG